MKPVQFSGELYSNEHSQRFKTDDLEVRLERGTESQGAFRLFDRVGLSQWFAKIQGVSVIIVSEAQKKSVKAKILENNIGCFSNI